MTAEVWGGPLDGQKMKTRGEPSGDPPLVRLGGVVMTLVRARVGGKIKVWAIYPGYRPLKTNVPGVQP